MKKNIITSATMLAIVGGVIFTLHSCKKEPSAQPQSATNPFNVSVVENPTSEHKALSLSGTRLVFPTIADYSTAINNPTVVAETELIKTINAFPSFTSWNEKYSSGVLFQNTLLSTLLNGDGIVQIGSNIFRLDKTYDKVFVLPVADIAYYSDLVALSPQSGKVYMFSTNDVVLEQIAAGALNQTVVSTVEIDPVSTVKARLRIRIKLPRIDISICREHGVGSRTDSKPIVERPLYHLTVTYNNNGIEFNLGAFVNWTASGSHYMFQFTGGIDKGYVAYRVSCGNTVATEYTTDGKQTLYGQEYMAYRSMFKPLNKLYLGCRMVSKTTGVPQSEYAIIRVNM